jgi:hypothetical protein
VRQGGAGVGQGGLQARVDLGHARVHGGGQALVARRLQLCGVSGSEGRARGESTCIADHGLQPRLVLCAQLVRHALRLHSGEPAATRPCSHMSHLTGQCSAQVLASKRLLTVQCRSILPRQLRKLRGLGRQNLQSAGC